RFRKVHITCSPLETEIHATFRSHSGVKDIAAPPIFPTPQAAQRKSVPPLAAGRPRSAVPDPSRTTVPTPFVRKRKETLMTKHQFARVVEEDQKRPDQQPDWLERLRRNFDAEVHLPADISREFLSAALLWAVDNKVDFGLFHEASEIIIAHFGGDEIYLPSRWSDKRWHTGLEDKEPFDPSD
ncbi:hypothetical protein, partial [Rhizobium anhuiense]